jgi:hypothetical protein
MYAPLNTETRVSARIKQLNPSETCAPLSTEPQELRTSSIIASSIHAPLATQLRVFSHHLQQYLRSMHISCNTARGWYVRTSCNRTSGMCLHLVHPYPRYGNTSYNTAAGSALLATQPVGMCILLQLNLSMCILFQYNLGMYILWQHSLRYAHSSSIISSDIVRTPLLTFGGR